MKKNVLMAALIAVLAFGLFSCNKDEASKKDLLTREGGWQLAEGTITPAYETAAGDRLSDLMDYLYACEKDDEIYFDANGAERIKTNVKCAEGEGLQGDEVAALWHFDNEEAPEVLYMQLPFFYDETGNNLDAEQENCKIKEISKDEMQLSYTFKVDDETNTFQMTFKDPKKVAKK